MVEYGKDVVSARGITRLARLKPRGARHLASCPRYRHRRAVSAQEVLRFDRNVEEGGSLTSSPPALSRLVPR